MASSTVAPTDGYVVDETKKPKWQMSPLTKRRWENFKVKKRGYWSLWIISTLMVLSLFAEFIANDKPLVMTYKEDVYFPVLFSYPETTFGGVFETEAVYRSEAVQQFIKDGDGWMIWPLIPFSFDTIDLNTAGAVPEAPSARHWLGTDDVARDVTARIIYGFRLSVIFGLSLTFFSAVIGITVGATQGYFGHQFV
jgi:microcin C transport system permease protein